MKSFQKYKESAKQLLHTNCNCIALYTDMHVLSGINMWQKEREQQQQQLQLLITLLVFTY